MRPARLIASCTLPLGLGSCNIDAVLEGKPPPDTRISMSVETSSISAVQGGTATLRASITRLGVFHGAVGFALTGLPPNVSAVVGTSTTTGQVTSAPITFHVARTTPVGAYLVTIRGTADRNGATLATVELQVAPRPAVMIAIPASALTIIRGGIAPVHVSIVRTAFAGPVSLSFLGAPGISATVSGDGGPVSGTDAVMNVSVSTGVPPGTYAATLRSSGVGIDDSEVALSIVVSADPLQLIVGNAATSQASLVVADVIVNRNGADGAVTFSIDGLPAGITPAFAGGEASTHSATLTLVVGATVVPGQYGLTLRGRSAGVADALAPFVLTVGASNVAVTLVPSTVTLLQGSTAASTLTLVRSAFSGPVGVELLGVPAGITVAAADATVIGTTTVLVVTTDRELAPGTYVLTVRAVPAPSGAGAPALSPVTSMLTITVVEAPSGEGNVVLDWSRCAAPAWVAGQDGSGPWVPLIGAAGIYRFAAADRGGFAYLDGESRLNVRYGTAAELGAATIDLCPQSDPPLHVAFGVAEHIDPVGMTQAGVSELFAWHLGGGTGTSTPQAPAFGIQGVRPGTHDLIAWGISANAGRRALIRRDVPEGAPLGTINLRGEGAVTPASATVSFSGFAGETAAYSMRYLTRAGCTADILVDTLLPLARTGTVLTTQLGIPPDQQRADDYHQVEMRARSTGGVRTTSHTVHSLQIATTYPLPPLISVDAVTLAGSYTRMRATVQTLWPAYNGSMTLTYSGGGRTVTVTASVAYLAGVSPELVMPELGGVSGFPAAAAVPLGSSGTWSLTLDGSNGLPSCSEGSSRWSNTRTGIF